MPAPRICVVGSLNADYITRVPHLPRPGETIAADSLEMRFGGKGANQAIAAARQGAAVSMIGAVGKDEVGKAYLTRLRSEGIDVRAVREVDEPTGSAFINVDTRGENTIVVAAGANGLVTADHLAANRGAIVEADFVILQLETTWEAVREACRIAREAGRPVLFNPSPWRPDFPWMEIEPDYWLVNEGEAQQLTAAKVNRAVMIVTRGAEPTRVLADDNEFTIPTFAVKPIDTVGAGDAFAGTLAAWLARGEPLPEAVHKANAAAALTTLKLGAQEAIPDEAATLRFIAAGR